MLDARTALSVAVGRAVALVSYYWPKIKARLAPAPILPRGDAVVVLECVRLNDAAREAARASADVRWIDCSLNFGVQLKALRDVRATSDASFGVIVVVDPLKNFEALDPSLAHSLVENYLRGLGRCAAGRVPVFAVNADLSLAVLERPGWLAPPFFRLLTAADPPPGVRALAVMRALGKLPAAPG